MNMYSFCPLYVSVDMHGWRYASLTPERYGGFYFYSTFRSSFINHRSMSPSFEIRSTSDWPQNTKWWFAQKRHYLFWLIPIIYGDHHKKNKDPHIGGGSKCEMSILSNTALLVTWISFLFGTQRQTVFYRLHFEGNIAKVERVWQPCGMSFHPFLITYFVHVLFLLNLLNNLNAE